jgi:hypothetical protein
VRQSRPPQQCAYPYYHDNPIQNYTDDTASQHSNLLTTSFTNTLSRHQQRQQNRRSMISSSSSSVAAPAPSNLPHYIKYTDLEAPSSTRSYYQQHEQQQSLASRPAVSGILHQPSYQQQQQQQQQQPSSYYPSSVMEQQQRQQPMSSSRVHRLLSMYDSMLKPATGAAGTNSSPPMSPPSSIQQHQYSQLQDQPSYIDYRHH